MRQVPQEGSEFPIPGGMGEESRNKEEEMRGENGLHRRGEKS